MASEEGLPRSQVVQLLLHMGVSWCVGVGAFGVVIVNNSSECRISRQHLCQAALFLLSLSVFAAAKVRYISRLLLNIPILVHFFSFCFNVLICTDRAGNSHSYTGFRVQLPFQRRNTPKIISSSLTKHE